MQAFTINEKDPYYLRRIKQEFTKRIASNPQYSLRAFARDCKIDQGVLSLIFHGKRLPSKRDITFLPPFLGLNATEERVFLRSVSETRRWKRLQKASGMPLFCEKISVDIEHVETARHLIEEMIQNLRLLSTQETSESHELAICLLPPP